MWKSRPVVASAVGGILDQIEEGVSGLLLHDPSDPAEFGAAVCGLLEDEALRSRIGSGAHTRLRQRFWGRESSVSMSISAPTCCAIEDLSPEHPGDPVQHRFPDAATNGTNQMRNARYPRGMTIQRMDNVGIVVDDLDAAIAFFAELGMELEGRMPIEGSWAENVVGLDDMRSEIAMMRIPDAPGRLELAKYHTPKAITPKPEITPANTLGLHRVMFAVDDIEDTLARLRPHGAELVSEVARYEDSYLLCYLRGPSGIILALAEQLS